MHDPDTVPARITVVDKATGKPIPCRIHLKDAAGKPQRAEGLPFWDDHFVCEGTVELRLTPGEYSYEVERGPEYSQGKGSSTVAAGAANEVTVELERIADLAAEGWWSGELHVHRPVEEVELLMRAEDLHVAPVITWWNNRNLWADRALPKEPLVRFDGDRYYHVMGGEDEREGGALLYFQLPRPLEITGASREYPSPMKFLAEARRHEGVWVDVEKPFWWDVPVWLASGQVDSIGLANNHMCRSRMYEDEAWGKPRNAKRLPAPLGNGFWTQEIYYHALNCGLRIPPSAGSASGVLPNPVGYNRVYVHLGERLDHAAWWEGLRSGRSFVTNGPLLRVRASGELPGHVFSAREGEAVSIDLEIALTSRDPIRAVEVIHNGRVIETLAIKGWSPQPEPGSRHAAVNASFRTKLLLKESGWFLVRVLADNDRTFRFASTAPYYVEIGSVKRRISKASAKFFRDWAEERIGRIKLENEGQRAEVLKHHERAKLFWLQRLADANAE